MNSPGKFNIRKVLVAPLDWGLGHATRDIPLIRALLLSGREVVLAASGAQAILLQTEFPRLTILPLPGYQIRYGKRPLTLALRLLIQTPRLLRVIKRENQWLSKTITDLGIDLVISDNRYGLYSPKVPCIFITHQLRIQVPIAWLEDLVQKIHFQFINKFHSCWVPDMAGEPNAAGRLSHPTDLPDLPVQYIGLLSRFKMQPEPKVYDYCFLLSGPEPQRTILETKILQNIEQLNGTVLLVRGKPGSDDILTVPAHVTVKNHLPGNALQQALLQSESIICRSGYSSLMELFALQKKMLLIPTPGQTEQEYLAKKYTEEGYSLHIRQDVLDTPLHLPLLRAVNFTKPSFDFFHSEHLEELLARTIGR